MLLASGAVNYFKMTEPHIFRNRELVGFESDEASKKYSLALEKFDAIGDQLKQLAKDDKVFLKMISDTYGELIQLYGFYEPDQHNALLLKAADSKMPEKYKTVGMAWIRAAIEEMTAMKERDKAVVKNMVSSNQSGILFIGLWHLESIANLMKQGCLQENSIPVRASERVIRNTSVR